MNNLPEMSPFLSNIYDLSIADSKNNLFLA